MSAPVAEKDIKEVAMDVASAPQEGGGGTRKRRGRRRRTQKGGADEEEALVSTQATVEKEGATATPVAPTTIAAPAPVQTGGAAIKKKTPVVVIAPAKKKPAKLLLVPKAGAAAATPAKHRVVPKKTFKAKRVRVIIDNTAKTIKRRRQILGQVDAMTEDQLRAAAVQARLARRDSVAAVPKDLLRQMVRDYQTMRGALL
jgi:hypothetical protein